MKEVNEFEVYRQISELSELLASSIIGVCKSVKNKEVKKPLAKAEIEKSVKCFKKCSLMLIDGIDNENSKTIKKSVLYISDNLLDRAVDFIDRITAYDLLSSNAMSAFLKINLQRIVKIPSLTSSNNYSLLEPKEILIRDIVKISNQSKVSK